MSPRRRTAPPGPTAVDALAESLRERILTGRLEPGEALTEEAIAAEASVSRHTARAAIARLSTERLVTAQPYHGARVTTLDGEALDALQQLRCALEAEAVRLLSERYPAGWPSDVLSPIERVVDRLETEAKRSPDDWRAVERAHADVHLALVGAADSPRITETYRSLIGELQLLLLQVRPQYDADGLVDEHRRWLEALQLEGPDAARAHIAHSTAMLLGGSSQSPTSVQ